MAALAAFLTTGLMASKCEVRVDQPKETTQKAQ